jgi:regulator of sigma E protease
VIGVLPALAPTFDVDPDGPAARAGISAEDRVVRFAGAPIDSVEGFEARRIENRSREVVLGVRGPDGTERDVTIEVGLAQEASCLVGIRPWTPVVKAVRGRAAAITEFLRSGDELVALVRVAPDGTRLPIAQLRDADDLAAALARPADDRATLRIELDRDGQRIAVALPVDADSELAADVALVQDPDDRRVRVMPGYPAEQMGMRDGAEVTRVGSVAVQEWREIKQRIEAAASAPGADDPSPAAIEIVAIQDGVEQVFKVAPRVERLPLDFGLVPVLATVKRSYPMRDAVRVGVSSAGYMIKNVYLTLRKIVSREVSASNLSGILTIAYVSRSLADSGLPTLFFFLSVLSLNLAFLNLLPIPVLDGGHLVFLFAEAVRGKPLSLAVRLRLTQLGLLVLIGIMALVLTNDFFRLIGG